MIAAIPPPGDTAQTRLWVDRVFTARGSGTVVTGTLSSGRIAVGDELHLAPYDRPVHVRSLQTLKTTVEQASAVARVAVNLRGLKLADVHRGDALVTPGGWAHTTMLDVRLLHPVERLPTQLIVHIGSAAVSTHVRLLSADAARLVLATAVPVHIGERALLRDPGEQRIAAGVVVLDTDPPPLRRRGAATARAGQLAGMSGDPDPAGEVRRRRAVPRRQLVAAGVLAPDAVKAGRLLRIADGVYLLPDAPEHALTHLLTLAQPFTLSEARIALATTRRVAVPLLELLDRCAMTSRVDANRRTVTRHPGKAVRA